MGENDIAERTFMELDDVFADIFNGLIFKGRQIIKPEALSTNGVFSQYKADSGRLHEQERDISKAWKYPKNLMSCFRPKLSDDEVTRVLKNYISDYKVNVFDMGRLAPEAVKLFKSDFRLVADYFVNSRGDSDYRPDEAVIQHVDEFLKLMAVLTGDNRYEEIGAELSEEDRKAGISMCKVLDYREARGEARGK